jgi:hypothetical protein
VHDVAARLWSLLGGDHSTLEQLELSGAQQLFPSTFDVTSLACAAIGVATLSVAELDAARHGRKSDRVRVATRESVAAFRCEALFTPVGWELPPLWDPIAGDYRGVDGWIRLHTNYANHRAACLRALGLQRRHDREVVTAEVAQWGIDELESRVVEEGGAAAAMRTPSQWLAHPQGKATASAPPVEIDDDSRGGSSPLPPSVEPLDGVKVLDLTRVIAGPFATRFLAAWGADVLRIDPPGFEEVPAIVPESTAGKRCALLDLRTKSGRLRLLELVHQADVVVCGYRPGGLEALGLDMDTMRTANPGVITVRHDAYGWRGPWASRRGFDSLVQMSCGIAAAGGNDRPRPLPAQALDHTLGMLLAASVCRALAVRTRRGVTPQIRGSLIGVANLLADLRDPAGASIAPTSFTDGDLERRPTWWGPAFAVPIPGLIANRRPRLAIEPGPLGRDEPSFSQPEPG